VIPADSTRRTLLQGLVVALGGDQAGLLVALGRRARAVAAWLAPGAAESATASLSRDDLDDLVAFTGVLVTGAELPDVERGHVVDHIQEHERAGNDYQVEAYRATVRVLGRLAGARFARLDVAGRLALVRRHELGRSVDRPGDTDDTRVVRARVVPDLIGAYYGSPAGWAVVGYRAFPGRCDVLDRYTRPGP